MPARQIPEYTDAQLAREIERTGTRKMFGDLWDLPRDEYDAFREYYAELLAEAARREVIRGRPLRAAGAPSWTLDAAPGTHLRTDRVA